MNRLSNSNILSRYLMLINIIIIWWWIYWMYYIVLWILIIKIYSTFIMYSITICNPYSINYCFLFNNFQNITYSNYFNSYYFSNNFYPINLYWFIISNYNIRMNNISSSWCNRYFINKLIRIISSYHL